MRTKLKLIPLFILLFMLQCCSKEKEDSPDKIVGRWKIIYEKVYDTESNIENCQLLDRFTFTENPNNVNLIRYSGAGATCNQTVNVNGTWSKSGELYYIQFFEGNAIPYNSLFANNFVNLTSISGDIKYILEKQ